MSTNLYTSQMGKLQKADASFKNLPDSILIHPIAKILSSAMTKLTKTIPPLFRIIFLEDLKQSNFPTFSWEQP
ncbi:uncharacterized protein VP01_3876g2 [Puccinia sorghi]|uniref:Uncharacterized protein n=1 Tax=Puccinia sorghi TaxID=27349 RepID=A0A0L6UUV1_9BASI|nr:uncharacterized protein VP01_3876g2 [Puccinia sorghi]